MKKIMLVYAALAAIGMAAYAADHDTPQRTGDRVALTAGEALNAGEMGGIWTNGYVYAASLTKTLTVVGRIETKVASGATAILQRGVFRWDNGGDSVADKDIGSTVYVWTNTAYTVCLTPLSASYTNSVGKVFDVDSSGVWVRSGY